MFRKLMLASAVGLPLGLTGAIPAATADDVVVHFGVPFYTYQVGPRYRYYDDYGWYDADAYPHFRSAYLYDDDYDGDEDYDGYVAVAPERLSCREARRIVRTHGFRDVSVRDCDGRNYVFGGFRNGRFAIIYVNSRTGRVWRG